jgi:hypothetical protein
VEETLQGGRGAIDGQGELLAHDGDGEIYVSYATQDTRNEITALEGFRVALVSDLVVGSAVYVIEYWTGQPPLGQTLEIMKVVAIAQAHRAETSQQSPGLAGQDYAKSSPPAMPERFAA